MKRKLKYEGFFAWRGPQTRKMQVSWSCVKNEYSIKIYFEERNKLPSKKMKIKIINNQAKTSLVLAWFFSRLIIIHAEISKVWIWLSTCILPRWQYAWILPGWMKIWVTYFLFGANEAWLAVIVAVKQHCCPPTVCHPYTWVIRLTISKIVGCERSNWMEGYAQFDDSNLINESVQMEMEFFERAANSSQENEDSDEIIVTLRPPRIKEFLLTERVFLIIENSFYKWFLKRNLYKIHFQANPNQKWVDFGKSGLVT